MKDTFRITGMNPKVSFETNYAANCGGIIPSALRDCSTYQFQYASLLELEFHE
jgi:hypothetical protein